MKRTCVAKWLGFLSLLLGFVSTAGRLAPVAAGVNHKQLRAQGEALFLEKGCSHCHGPAGFGGSDSGPDLSDVRKRLQPEQIAHQIHDGGKNMPPFGDSLSEDQIASLVEYLHSKRKAPKLVPQPRLPEKPAKPAPDPD